MEQQPQCPQHSAEGSPEQALPPSDASREEESPAQQQSTPGTLLHTISSILGIPRKAILLISVLLILYSPMLFGGIALFFVVTHWNALRNPEHSNSSLPETGEHDDESSDAFRGVPHAERMRSLAQTDPPGRRAAATRIERALHVVFRVTMLVFALVAVSLIYIYFRDTCGYVFGL